MLWQKLWYTCIKLIKLKDEGKKVGNKRHYETYIRFYHTVACSGYRAVSGAPTALANVGCSDYH